MHSEYRQRGDWWKFLDEAAWGAVASDVRQQIVSDAEDMLRRLVFCIVIERHPQIRARLRAIAQTGESEPLLVRPPSVSDAWLLLRARDGGVESLRDPTPGLARLEIDDHLFRGAGLEREILAATGLWPIQAAAIKLLNPIFNTGLLPNRHQVVEVAKWAPVLERLAYRCFTHGMILLDQLRPKVLAAASSQQLEPKTLLSGYWYTLHTMSYLLPLASMEGARPWLSKMALSFSWVTWTPSYVLSRERTLWLLVAAAKSAAIFGQTVIERYIARLVEADHLIGLFDALVGLVAIGLDERSQRIEILSELETISPSMLSGDKSSAELGKAMLVAAVDTLQDPDLALQRFRTLVEEIRPGQLNMASGLIALDAFRYDPTDLLASGSSVGFLALPSIAQSEWADFYPRHRRQPTISSPIEISLIVKRAWKGPAIGRQSTLH